MKLFTASLLSTTIFLLLLFLSISFLNIYLFVRHHQSRQLRIIHLFSFFAEAFLFCVFMQLPVLPDTIRTRFSHYSVIFLFFMLLSLFYGFFSITKKNQFALTNYRLSPKLSDIFETMDDAVLIADHNGILIDTNQAAKQFILQHLVTEAKSLSSTSIPTTLSEFFTLMLPHLSPNDSILFNKAKEGTPSTIQTEFTISGISYFMFFSTIYADRRHSTSVGINIIFHNIQEEKLLRASLTNQNKTLTLANEALRNNLKIANSLAEEKVRLLLIKELQHSIIQHIEKVIQEISTFQASSKLKQPANYQSFFVHLSEELRMIFKEVRHNIQKLSNKMP